MTGRSLSAIFRVCIKHMMRSADLIRKLKQDGWVLRNTREGHYQFTHPNKSGWVTVKHPAKDIPRGTLRNINRQAQWKWNDR